MRKINVIRLLFVFVLTSTNFFALNNDSLLKIRLPKHYFQTCINFDVYGMKSIALNGNNFTSKKLENYQLNQFSLGFNSPIYTKDFYKKDSSKISNFHLLLVGSYVSVIPKFEGISKHYLSKAAIGVRGLYNTGKKSIFYAELTPFFTQDNGFSYTQQVRFSTTLLYSHVVNDFFSFRVGYTRSFILGNRYHLPYIGFRVGRLDRINFSIQFPRSMSLNIPINKYIKTSLYTKPQGGVYSFANTDTIYYLNNDKKLNFGRYEFLGGFRLDVMPSGYFSFYLSGGLASKNYIGFYSETYNSKNKGIYGAFFKEKLSKSSFFNFGLVFKFGKVKSIYNNYNLYELQDLNNKDVDNLNKGNTQIPYKERNIKRVQPSEIIDLIEASDLY